MRDCKSPLGEGQSVASILTGRSGPRTYRCFPSSTARRWRQMHYWRGRAHGLDDPTAGFRDVIEMRRRDRPDTWGLWGMFDLLFLVTCAWK